MSKTIVVVGYGPGISNAVAEKFGANGFTPALVARSADKLEKGVASLKAKNIEARAVRADASDPESIRGAIRTARASGPIAAIHWNAYGGEKAGDFLEADPKTMHSVFDVGIVSLVAAVQEALPDLKANSGAVLVTNGAFGELNPQVDAFAVQSKFMGLGLGNAAKHKLVGLLAARLKSEGVYIGEVMVAGTVKGTAWDRGQATLEPSQIANAFWTLHEGRSETYARVT